MKIHFIGIGGVSMSGLAQICLNLGYDVSGSDSQKSDLTEKLENLGGKIYIGQSSKNITADRDLVVYTAAIREDNEELKAARHLGIECIDRASFLGKIMKKYENALAIAGTHGKTSTTSMTSLIFQTANLDPTILVGGNLKEIGGNVRIGNSGHFITEACEYVNSFLQFSPKVAVILNIEEDHLDFFSGLDEIKESFSKFSQLVPQDGYVIINGDDPNTNDVLNNISGSVITFGTNENCNARICDIAFDSNGYPSFNIIKDGELLGTFSLKVRGLHNIYNATASILSGFVSGIETSVIKTGIEAYGGVGRRFELKGEKDGMVIYDDYAHHPTEIKATLNAAKNMDSNRVWCIFQPHTYTRTLQLLDEFALSFDQADEIIITDIYAAREKDNGKIHSKDLVSLLEKRGLKVSYMNDFNDIAKKVLLEGTPKDLVFTVGAGDVYKIGNLILGDC